MNMYAKITHLKSNYYNKNLKIDPIYIKSPLNIKKCLTDDVIPRV